MTSLANAEKRLADQQIRRTCRLEVDSGLGTKYSLLAEIGKNKNKRVHSSPMDI